MDFPDFIFWCFLDVLASNVLIFPNSSGGEANNPFMKKTQKQRFLHYQEGFQDSVLKTGMEILPAIHPASDGFFIGTGRFKLHENP